MIINLDYVNECNQKFNGSDVIDKIVWSYTIDEPTPNQQIRNTEFLIYLKDDFQTYVNGVLGNRFGYRLAFITTLKG